MGHGGRAKRRRSLRSALTVRKKSGNGRRSCSRSRASCATCVRGKRHRLRLLNKTLNYSIEAVLGAVWRQALFQAKGRDEASAPGASARSASSTTMSEAAHWRSPCATRASRRPAIPWRQTRETPYCDGGKRPIANWLRSNPGNRPMPIGRSSHRQCTVFRPCR